MAKQFKLPSHLSRLGGKKKGNLAGKAAKRSIFGMLKLVFLNPFVGGVLVLVGIIWIVYVGNSFNNEIAAVTEQYKAVSANRQDSKADFDKRERYLVTLPDGTITISESYRNAMGYVDDNGNIDTDMNTDDNNNNDKPPTFETTGTSVTFTWPMNLYYKHDNGSLIQATTNTYYKMGVEFSGDRYKTLNWSRGTRQRSLSDLIKDNINTTKIYATYDSMPLTAMGQYFPNIVGKVVRVHFSSGDSVDMIVVDAKANTDTYPRNPNASAFADNTGTTPVGHYYVDSNQLAITEFIAGNGHTKAAFNAQFGTNIKDDTVVTKIELLNKDYLE